MADNKEPKEQGRDSDVVPLHKQGLRHPLTEADLRYMNLPNEFWRKRHCLLSRVPPSVRDEVRNYVTRIESAVRSGTGLLLHGPRGTGKTAIAAIVCKAARLHRFSCFFVAIWDLREMIRARVKFDSDTSIMTRCREVDVLVLDDLRACDTKEVYLSVHDLEGLLRHRASRHRLTIITTRLVPAVLITELPAIGEAVQSCILSLNVQGPDQQAAHMKRARAYLLKGESGNSSGTTGNGA